MLVLVVGGSFYALGRMSADEGGGDPKVEVPHLSQEEQELLKIKIAAAELEIEEVRKTADGWVVRVAKDTAELDLAKMSQEAATFFHDLARADVEIAATSYVVRTSDLKDVWGNRLTDVSLLRIGLDRPTFARINWGGFDPKNFPRVTDDFWMHDLVAEKARAQQNEGGEGGQGSGSGQGQGGEDSGSSGGGA